MIQYGQARFGLNASSIVMPLDHIEFSISKEDTYIILDPMSDHAHSVPPSEWLAYEKTPELIETAHTLSDCVKVVITASDSFYMWFHSFMPIVYKLFKYNPAIYFIVHIPRQGSVESVRKSRNQITEDTKDFFDSLGINYYIHSVDDKPIAMRVNNTLDIEINEDFFGLTAGDTREVVDELKRYVLSEEDLNMVPHRKVYLSRAHIKSDRSRPRELLYKGIGQYSDDLRMEQEEVLEEYFRSNGYEIVIPESRFNGIREQIKFFNETSIIAGVTGSGLSNSLFMQENQCVIDLTAELIFDNNTYGAVQLLNSELFIADAYIRNHFYVSIPTRRDPYATIRLLEKFRYNLHI